MGIPAGIPVKAAQSIGPCPSYCRADCPGTKRPAHPPGACPGVPAAWLPAAALRLIRKVLLIKIERFQPEGMNIRTSGGKPSYSHVVTVSGSGKIVYTAGQLARDIDGNCVGKGDMRAQMEQTFQNLDRSLKAAGATWADVVKTNTFVTDFDEFQKCADIRMRDLGVATPTSTTVGVTRLAGPDFMIEIEAVPSSIPEKWVRAVASAAARQA